MTQPANGHPASCVDTCVALWRTTRAYKPDQISVISRRRVATCAVSQQFTGVTHDGVVFAPSRRVL